MIQRETTIQQIGSSNLSLLLKTANLCFIVRSSLATKFKTNNYRLIFAIISGISFLIYNLELIIFHLHKSKNPNLDRLWFYNVCIGAQIALCVILIIERIISGDNLKHWYWIIEDIFLLGMLVTGLGMFWNKPNRKF